MESESMKDSQIEPPTPRVLLMLGILLLIIGVAIAGFVVFETLNVYGHGLDHHFVESIVTQLQTKVVLEFDGKNLVLGLAGAKILAYVLFAMMAVLGSSFAALFIRSGAEMLSPKYGYKFVQLKQDLKVLSDKIEKYSPKINKF